MDLKNKIQQEIQRFNTDKRGQVQGVVVLLALILVGAIGGIIGLTLFNSVKVTLPTTLSTNANLNAVENTYFPLFIVGVVAGTAIAGLIYAITLVLGRVGR